MTYPHSELDRLRHLVATMEKERPPEGAIVLLLSDETRAKIRQEAERRLVRPEKLAAGILTVVAHDDLFSAVIDA